ncbi:hypothetical protein PS1_006047 [Malus domestica]
MLPVSYFLLKISFLKTIENEYGTIDQAYGAVVQTYIKWAASMTVVFKYRVPWVMWQQKDAPASVVRLL